MRGSLRMGWTRHTLAPGRALALGVRAVNKGCHMIQSMTAFASATGTLDAVSWVWEVRCVNARGLDIRMRLPDGINGLEAAVRAALTKSLSRGNVSVTLRVTYGDNAQGFAVDEAQLDRVLQALDQVQDRAFAMGVTLGQPTAADVLRHQGVISQSKNTDASDALSKALIADVSPLIADLVAMRISEGEALHKVISAQIDQIGTLTAVAKIAAEARRDDAEAAMTAAIARVSTEVPAVDKDRLAQELALLAVKTDITEEIDRLASHTDAARALLAQAVDGDKPLGRKLDFLSQEFNREANTLCAKSQNAALTSIGLDLKAVIDQMREQIQNVE